MECQRLVRENPASQRPPAVRRKREASLERTAATTCTGPHEILARRRHHATGSSSFVSKERNAKQASARWFWKGAGWGLSLCRQLFFRCEVMDGGAPDAEPAPRGPAERLKKCGNLVDL